MQKVILQFIVCILLLGFQSKAQDIAPTSISFTALSKIPLHTTTGKKVFVQKANAPLQLFIMLSPECPLCKNYSLALNRLKDKYGQSMKVYGIIPGVAYSGAELETFAADYKIQFPLLIDTEKRIANYLRATVTPEVILADSTGVIVYRGAIDDWVQELGKKKLQPQQHFLDWAIRQYLDGEPVRIRSTIAKGCLINEF